MLPEVVLKDVTRADVARIAIWLDDEDVSSRWFGHYACGDPVHRGYEPVHMATVSHSEWDRVFNRDPRRFIFSIYCEDHGHIGESQVICDEAGRAELSLLIGRKDLWHHAYGTSTVMVLLDKIFNYYKLQRAWVNVPEDNTPALGLFKKLGFVNEGTLELCNRPDGTALRACILAMDANNYRAREAREDRRASVPAVTIVGLPGSGSDTIGEEIARMTQGRFVDEEIATRTCLLLKRSMGELEALESSYRSAWRRILRVVLEGWEQTAAFDSDGLPVWSPITYYEPHEHLTKDRYLDGLKRVTRELALEGNVVLHGHRSHLLTFSHVPTVSVLVTASEALRRQRIAADQGLNSKDAARWLKRADRDSLAIFMNLVGCGLLDTGHYDLILNMDLLTSTCETAAREVVGALETETRTTRPEVYAL